MSSALTERTPLLKIGNSGDDESAPRIYEKKRKSYCLWTSGTLVIALAVVGAAAGGYLFGYSAATGGTDNSPQSRISRDKIGLQSLSFNSWPIRDAPISNVSSEPIWSALNSAVEYGKRQLQRKRELENNATESGVSINSASYGHQNSIASSPIANKQSQYGYVEVEASKYLKKRGVDDVIYYSDSTGTNNLSEWANESGCRRKENTVSCDYAAPYRTIDASCNNLKHPLTWGVAMTPYRRALRPAYQDGVSIPRGGYNSSSLPSARQVSVRVHRPIYEQDANFTVMLAVWGQFVDHDISATASSKSSNGTTIACCGSGGTTNTECFPVTLDTNDEYYSEYNVTCMEFARSAPALTCSFGPREQINQVSSYVDASMVYGNLDEAAKRLRSFKGGQLAVSYSKDGRALLPLSVDPSDGCNREEEMKRGRYCFAAGRYDNTKLGLTTNELRP